MGQLSVSVRLFGTTLALLGVFGLYRGTLATRVQVSVFQAVYSHCIIVLVSLGYYCMGKFCYVACNPVPPRQRRHNQTPHQHVEMQRLSMPCSDTTQLVLGVPKLTIHNVWILVYGLGFVFFITGYCFLGLHPACIACAGLAMGVLGVDELICPRASARIAQIHFVLRSCSLLAVVVSLTLVSVDLLFDGTVVDYVASLDLYSISFGLALPFCSQFLMILVRDSRNYYTLGTVLEVCEFGFPFTTFLGVFHLSVAYGQRFQIDAENIVIRQTFMLSDLVNTTRDPDYYYWYHANATAMGVMRADGPFILFYSLAPLLMMPAMISYVSSVLDGRAIDPLLSLTLALCVERLVVSPFGPASTLGIYGTVFCSLAIIIRILSEYHPQIEDLPVFNLQAESIQLNERAIKERDRRVAQEARDLEELTKEFELDRLN